MIESFKHKGLKRLHELGDRSRINPAFAAKAERFLTVLHVAEKPEDLDVPGYGLHRLTGNLRGFWSAVLSRNHRITFRFEEGSAYDVDLVDYH